MKGKITILILSFFALTSCKLTERKAKVQLTKIEANYSYLFANPCSRLYPIRERVEIEKEYTKGDVIIRTDTTYINCNDTANKGKTVAVPCVSTHRVDTSKIVEKSIQENTAKVDFLNQQLQAEKRKCIDSEIAFNNTISNIKAQKSIIEKDLKKYKKIEKTVFWIVGIMASALLLFAALKFGWFGKIWKLIKKIF